MPSYSTIRRYLRACGFTKRRRKVIRTSGQELAEWHREHFEVRSFEAAYVHSLWHLDFHELKRPVLTRDGQWQKPNLLAILDDCSRLACHTQWYLSEDVDVLVHGFLQALQKRGLPWELMHDRGSAMRAAEFCEGLAELGIIQSPTLPYSPNQNGKQEVFFAAVEGRLIAMLENYRDLTLELLNDATQAWVELDYNRKVHTELGVSPLERFSKHRSVGRDSPSSLELKQAFRACGARKQRKSDGTISLLGRRFEIPSRYRHIDQLHLRYARWDLSSVDLFDARTRKILCPIFPLDKTKNADRQRRPLEAIDAVTVNAPSEHSIAPLLQKLMADYAATGLPPAYLPKEFRTEEPS